MAAHSRQSVRIRKWSYVLAIAAAVLAVTWPARAGPGDDRGRNAGVPAASGDGRTPGDRRVVGFTAPQHKATLAALQQGRIATFLVQEGQRVQAGALLVELEAEVQQARTEIARLEAESTLDIDLARVRLDWAERELERVVQLGGTAAVKELSDARAEAEIRRVELALARRKHEQALVTYTLQRGVLEQHRIRASFDGYVSARLKDVGETVEEREGVLVLVQLDPLLACVDCPAELAAGIHQGDEYVVCPVDPRWPPRAGVVQFISPVVDAASQTIKVKLRIGNEDGQWPAGLSVAVDFSTAGRSAASGAGTVTE